MTMTGMTTSEQALKDALKFTDDDLKANRGGKLSAAQRAAFARRSIVFGGLLIVSVIVFALAYSALPSRESDPFSPIALALMPVSLALIGFSLFELFGAFVKLQRDSITSMRGKAVIEMDTSKRRLFGKLKVGKFEMVVPKEQLVAFHEGATYIVYYTAYPKHILSAEFVSG
jgi:hypothetical protein